MKLADETIDSIAQDIDMGMEVYLHRETGDTIAIPDELRMDMGDPELWEDFTGQIEDDTIRTVLDVVLSNAKPFRNFKNTLNRFPEVRQEWFEFNHERMKQWVMEQIE